MIRFRWLSPLRTLIALTALTAFIALAAVSVLATTPLPADESVAAEAPVQLEPAEERVLLAPPCDPGETQHQCDVQDNCTGRHFRDSVCCGAGTTGDCLVAVNGLGCVESVDAVCVPD